MGSMRLCTSLVWRMISCLVFCADAEKPNPHTKHTMSNVCNFFIYTVLKFRLSDTDSPVELRGNSLPVGGLLPYIIQKQLAQCSVLGALAFLRLQQGVHASVAICQIVDGGDGIEPFVFYRSAAHGCVQQFSRPADFEADAAYPLSLQRCDGLEQAFQVPPFDGEHAKRIFKGENLVHRSYRYIALRQNVSQPSHVDQSHVGGLAQHLRPSLPEDFFH